MEYGKFYNRIQEKLITFDLDLALHGVKQGFRSFSNRSSDWSSELNSCINLLSSKVKDNNRVASEYIFFS